MRDASWIMDAGQIEGEVRRAFDVVLETLKPQVFWDIGANIGFYSWLVRRSPSVREVILFEPDPINFGLINRTIQKNNLTDCTARNVALSQKAGESAFLLDDASGATGSLEATSDTENPYSLHNSYHLSQKTLCQTVSIDDLIANGVARPDLIKIDVEGAEHLVIAGAELFLASNQPAIIMETSNAEVVSSLQRIGYTALQIDGENLLFIAPADDALLKSFVAAFPLHKTPGLAEEIAKKIG